MKEQNIKSEKEKIENDINKLIKASKEKTSEYFGGAAFITFNTIKVEANRNERHTLLNIFIFFVLLSNYTYRHNIP